MTRDAVAARARLAAAPPQVFPSLLACDFGRLADEIDVAQRCGCTAVHWDVMDGLFVPNLTYGAPVIRSCRPASAVFFDTHLMMADPGKYLDDFLSAGCDSVTIHLEAVPSPGVLLKKIRAAGALAGLSINPPTPVTALEPWLEQVDLVNVMSVPPGFGGQPFDRAALDKLRWLKQHGANDLLLQVDGGINEKTIAAAAQAGASLLVVGSAFYGSADRAAAFGRLGSALAAQ